MSIMDILCEFSDGQSIILNGTSVISTDVVDLAAASLDFGAGEPIYLNIKIGTACAGGTSMQFDLYGHTTTTVNSGTVIHSTGAIVTATLVAGYEYSVILPVRCDDYGRYIGMYYTAVGNMTAGTVDAWLSLSQTSARNANQVRSSNI